MNKQIKRDIENKESQAREEYAKNKAKLAETKLHEKIEGQDSEENHSEHKHKK